MAEAIGDGDDGAYHDAWVTAADRLKAEGETALGKGHSVSARELYLKASAFYATSFHPLFGAPVDPRLLATFRKQVDALEKGLALGPHPVRPLSVPFGATPMPGYFIPAQGFEDEVRPLIILNNGYDATITDTYFASAVAASQRGYHSLLFDGPGQGAMLYEHGVPQRPDWEVVVNAVVDFALTLPRVDPRRIALYGWSLGGHLAPRGAQVRRGARGGGRSRRTGPGGTRPHRRHHPQGPWALLEGGPARLLGAWRGQSARLLPSRNARPRPRRL